MKNLHSIESRALRAVGSKGKTVPRWPNKPDEKLPVKQREGRENAEVQTVTQWQFDPGVSIGVLRARESCYGFSEHVADHDFQFVQAAIDWAVIHPEVAGGVGTDRYKDGLQRLNDLANI